MNKHIFYLSLCVVLLKCDKGLTALNVTFYGQQMTWQNAVAFCSQHDGVLESNTTIVKDKFQGIPSNMKNIWLGKYEAYSKWAYVRGCFLISGNLQHFAIEHSELLECQKLCEDYTFFTAKGTDCYCKDDLSSFHRTKTCNCTDCYQVWEHQLPEFTNEGTKVPRECIAATCTANKINRSYRFCEQNFFLICDNNRILNYSCDTHGKASNKCQSEGSFIKWYSDEYCKSTLSSVPLWTSGRRHIHSYHLRKSDDIDSVKLQKCFKLHQTGNTVTEESTDECNDKEMYPFVCKFGVDDDEGDTIYIPTTSISPEKNVQTDETANIAAGVIVSIIAVIAVILVLIFIYRRRLSNMKPNINETNNSDCVRDYNETSQAPVYNEIDGENFIPHKGKLNNPQTVNNITYDYASSNNTGKSQNEYHSVIISNETNEIHNKADHKVRNQIDIFSEGANSSDYCLAKPITRTIEKDVDPYDMNRDYDHLHNVNKKEEQITKVYDHLPTIVTEDPTYDHSHLKSVSDNEGHYDHFKIVREND